MIAVTCRNGEHFTLDPDAIERVESGGDTTVILDDGTKFVVGQSIDELVHIVRDHRATVLVVHQQMYGGIAAVAEHRAALRIERRARSRDGNSATTDRLRPDRDEG